MDQRTLAGAPALPPGTPLVGEVTAAMDAVLGDATPEQMALLMHPDVRASLDDWRDNFVTGSVYRRVREQVRAQVQARPESADWHSYSRVEQIRAAKWAGLSPHRIPTMRPARCATPRQRRAAPVRTTGSRRTSSSSRTSSADPGDSDPEPPPGLALWRHPRWGRCSPSLLRALLRAEREGVAR